MLPRRARTRGAGFSSAAATSARARNPADRARRVPSQGFPVPPVGSIPSSHDLHRHALTMPFRRCNEVATGDGDRSSGQDDSERTAIPSSQCHKNENARCLRSGRRRQAAVRSVRRPHGPLASFGARPGPSSEKRAEWDVRGVRGGGKFAVLHRSEGDGDAVRLGNGREPASTARGRCLRSRPWVHAARSGSAPPMNPGYDRE